MNNHMKHTLLSFGAIAIAAAALTACGSDKTEPGKDAPATTAAPAKTNPPAAVTSAPAATSAAATQAPAPTTAPTSAPAAAGPNGKSAVPKMDEWNAASEVPVKGASKLGCETKMVREWLRVSCRGKNDTGGEPKAVKVTKGGGKGEDFTFASNKVASLVTTFVDGTDLVAEFEWTDAKHELVVSWPHGAPMPPSKGTFK